MATIRTTMIEFLILGAFGIVIGFTANAVRAKNSIQFTRNYFDKGTSGEAARHTKTPADGAPAEPRAAAAPAAGKKPLDHPYQELDFDQVKAIFEGTDPATGPALFVDARDDQHYQEGHIPGAVQCDHYRLNDYLGAVLPLAQQADKVIVYCNGGDCEDSIFMCGDLIDAGIPFDRVYLYPGGWKQWAKEGMLGVTGPRPGTVDEAVQVTGEPDE